MAGIVPVYPARVPQTVQKRAPGASGAPQPEHLAAAGAGCEAGGGGGGPGGGPAWGVGRAVGGAVDMKVDGGGWLPEACC